MSNLAARFRPRGVLFAAIIVFAAMLGLHGQTIAAGPAQTPPGTARLPLVAVEKAAGPALVGHATLNDGTVIPLFDQAVLNRTPGFSHKLLAASGGKPVAEALGHRSTKLDYSPLKTQQSSSLDVPTGDFGYNYAYLYGLYYNGHLYYIYSVGVSSIQSGYGSVYTFISTRSTFGNTPETQGNFGYRIQIANSYQNVASTAVSGYLPEMPGQCYWGFDRGSIVFTDYPYPVAPAPNYSYTYCSY